MNEITKPLQIVDDRKPISIYVASSWRNEFQPQAVTRLRECGFDVYDFKNPVPGSNGFHWSEIGKGWKEWTPGEYIEALKHPVAANGFGRDMEALKACDLCVLILPSGRSAHIEAGWAIGANKPTCVLLDEKGFEPELMYLMAPLVTQYWDDVEEWCDHQRNILRGDAA